MAIDTAAKRRSAAGLPFWLFGPGVTPDATPDQFWRQSAGWSYGGILAGAAAEIIAAVEDFLAFYVARRHRRR